MSALFSGLFSAILTNSLEALVTALKDAGVDNSGLIVGIDFTRSNEW